MSRTTTPPRRTRRPYRLSDRVDIEPTTESGGGYDECFVLPGEYENYTVNVPSLALATFHFAWRASAAARFTSPSTAKTPPAPIVVIDRWLPQLDDRRQEQREPARRPACHDGDVGHRQWIVALHRQSQLDPSIAAAPPPLPTVTRHWPS